MYSKTFPHEDATCNDCSDLNNIVLSATVSLHWSVEINICKKKWNALGIFRKSSMWNG